MCGFYFVSCSTTTLDKAKKLYENAIEQCNNWNEEDWHTFLLETSKLDCEFFSSNPSEKDVEEYICFGGSFEDYLDQHTHEKELYQRAALLADPELERLAGKARNAMHAWFRR